MREKVSFYDKLLQSDNHKSIEKLYDRGIQILEQFVEKQ